MLKIMKPKQKSKKISGNIFEKYKFFSPQFIVDSEGKKSQVVLNVEVYEHLLEDLDDLLVYSQRKNEPERPFSEFVKKLKKDERI